MEITSPLDASSILSLSGKAEATMVGGLMAYSDAQNLTTLWITLLAGFPAGWARRLLPQALHAGMLPQGLEQSSRADVGL